jgi:uncharacterized membrane protein YfcA
MSKDAPMNITTRIVMSVLLAVALCFLYWLIFGKLERPIALCILIGALVSGAIEHWSEKHASR